jgi:hypothetical protein
LLCIGEVMSLLAASSIAEDYFPSRERRKLCTG